MQRRECPGFDLTVSVYWADGEYACERYASLFHPPLYYLLLRNTRNSGIWNANTNTYLGPPICAFCPEVLPREKPYTPVSMSRTRRSRAVCEARTADMCSLAGKNDDGKGPLDSPKTGHVSVGTGSPSDSPRPFFLRRDRGVFLTSNSVWFTLDPRLNITTLLPSTHLYDVSGLESRKRTDGRTRDPLSHCWLTPICDALSSQFRVERIPKLVSNR